jgi:hypothetical protein
MTRASQWHVITLNLGEIFMTLASSCPTDAVIGVNSTQPHHSTISWAAIFAGVVTAIALQMTLAHLCVAVGLAMYTPFDPAEPTATIAMVTIVAWVMCALISLFVGGWVAGRLAHYYSQVTAALHGVLVWATGVVVGGALLALSLGLIAGGTVNLAGEGIKAVASGVKAAGTTMATIAAPSWDAVREQIKVSSSAVATTAQEGKNDMRFADQSRMMDLLVKFFAIVKDQRLSANEQQELTTLVSSQLGISREAADKTLIQWQQSWDDVIARYESAKDEAKTKAMEVTRTAKKYTASAAGLCFGFMFVGMIAAALGGLLGSACFRCEEARRATRTPSHIVAP